MGKIADLLERLPQTQVLVVPSGSRDVHHTFIYPTPPFEEAQRCKRIRMMTDPCIVNVEGISFGITSTDILFHLGKVISQTLGISQESNCLYSNIIKHITSLFKYNPSIRRMRCRFHVQETNWEDLQVISFNSEASILCILPGNFSWYIRKKTRVPTPNIFSLTLPN